MTQAQISPALNAGSAMDIYNTLLEGKALKFVFLTKLEAYRCYSNVATVKHRQDKLAAEAGIYSKDDTGRLEKTLTTLGDMSYELVLKLNTEPVIAKQYYYQIIE